MGSEMCIRDRSTVLASPSDAKFDFGEPTLTAVPRASARRLTGTHPRDAEVASTPTTKREPRRAERARPVVLVASAGGVRRTRFIPSGHGRGLASSCAVRAVASAAQFTQRHRSAHGAHGRFVLLLPSRRHGSCARARGAAGLRAPRRRARTGPKISSWRARSTTWLPTTCAPSRTAFACAHLDVRGYR